VLIRELCMCKVVLATFGIGFAAHAGVAADLICIGLDVSRVRVRAVGHRHLVSRARRLWRGCCPLDGTLVDVHLGGWVQSLSAPSLRGHGTEAVRVGGCGRGIKIASWSWASNVRSLLGGVCCSGRSASEEGSSGSAVADSTAAVAFGGAVAAANGSKQRKRRKLAPVHPAAL
jgi:hypothetical protein